MGGQTQTVSNEQFPQGGGFQAGHANLMGGQTQVAHHEQLPQGGSFQARSDRRPIFDDKIASSDIMKFTDAKTIEWLKTAQNYLISKAFEMNHDLPWAESFPSHAITDDHVRGLSTSAACSDYDPLRLPFELWGHLNLR